MAISSGVVALVLTSASCLDPTQITVDATTDVRCADTKGTSFIGGKPGTTERAAPTTTTRDCDQGRIGTLVSTPSGAKDVDAEFVVVMGVDRPVNECTPANHFQGCVVERRLIHYVTHTPLNLPITMWLVCKDKECGPETTCARNGKCVSARISDPSACAGGGCFLEGEGPFVPGSDSGPGDGPTDGLADGAITDAPTIRDADGDAPPLVVPDPPPAGKLFCPPQPNGCNAGGTCCFSHAGSGGRCTGPCDGTEIAMQCNRKTDCAGVNDFCCGTVVNMAQVGQLIARNPVASLVPEAASPDANPGTRTLTNTSCAPSPGPCLGAWICTQPSDCPAPYVVCDKGSALFNPTGVFGECR